MMADASGTPTPNDDLAELVARWTAFCELYPQMRGLDPEVVYTLHASDEVGPLAITVSDLRAAVAAVARLRQADQFADIATVEADRLRAEVVSLREALGVAADTAATLREALAAEELEASSARSHAADMEERLNETLASTDDLVKQRDAARALAGRLWCDDRPDADTQEAIGRWLDALPVEEFEQLDAELEGDPSDTLAAWRSSRPVDPPLAEQLGAARLVPGVNLATAAALHAEANRPVAAGVAVPEAPRDEIILHPSTGEPTAYNVRLPTCECDDAPRSEHMEGCPVRAVPEATTEPKP